MPNLKTTRNIKKYARTFFTDYKILFNLIPRRLFYDVNSPRYTYSKLLVKKYRIGAFLDHNSTTIKTSKKYVETFLVKYTIIFNFLPQRVPYLTYVPRYTCSKLYHTHNNCFRSLLIFRNISGNNI